MINSMLLIDDDFDDRDLFCEAIKELGTSLKCYCAPDGQSAIDSLENGTFKDIEFIVLDVNMPMISGWDTLKKLKSNPVYNSIPVLMYTTSTLPVDIERANKEGAIGLVSKPTGYNSLRNLVRIISSTNPVYPSAMVQEYEILTKNSD